MLGIATAFIYINCFLFQSYEISTIIYLHFTDWKTKPQSGKQRVCRAHDIQEVNQ